MQQTREFIEREVKAKAKAKKEKKRTGRVLKNDNQLHSGSVDSLIENLWTIKNRMSCNI